MNSIIDRWNHEIVIPDEITSRIKKFTEDMKLDGVAESRYQEIGNSKKYIEINCYEGKLLEFALYLRLKANGIVCEEPDMAVWSADERKTKGREDPDLKTEQYNYHCKSTPDLSKSYKWKQSWTFRLSDPVIDHPAENDMIVCGTIMSDNKVKLNFSAKAVELLPYFERPVKDKYKSSKVCLYWETLKNL